jgi:hypothetical protein
LASTKSARPPDSLFEGHLCDVAAELVKKGYKANSPPTESKVSTRNIQKH